MSEWPAAPQLEEVLDQLAAEVAVDTPARAALATQLLERDRPTGNESVGATDGRIEVVRLDDRDDAPPRTSRPSRRRAVVVLVAAAVTAAIVVGGGVLLDSGDGDNDRVITEPTTTEADDQAPATTLPPQPPAAVGAVVGTPIELPIRGTAYAKAGAGSVWVANATDRLTRIDPATNEVVGTVELDFAATDLGTGDGSMWVGHAEGYVTQVDASTGEIVRLLDVGWRVDSMAYGSGSVWVASGGLFEQDGTVVRLDPTSGTTTVIPMAGGAWSTEEMDGNVWVANPAGGTVSRIDATDNSVTVIAVGPFVRGLDADNGSVWAAGGDGAYRIDPLTDEVTAAVSSPNGYDVYGPNVGPRFVWIYGLKGCSKGPCNAEVMRVDPETNDVVQVIELPAPGGAGGIWIGSDDVYLVVADVGLVPISIHGGP